MLLQWRTENLKRCYSSISKSYNKGSGKEYPVSKSYFEEAVTAKKV
jgi:hypothetical protein